MKAKLKKRLQSIFVLSAMAGLVIGIFYGAYHGPWDPTLRRISEERAKHFNERYRKPPPEPKDRIFLKTGVPRDLDRLRLVYRGTRDGRLHIAVTIFALDPEKAYAYRVETGKRGDRLQLGGEVFELVSYGKSALELKPKAPADR